MQRHMKEEVRKQKKQVFVHGHQSPKLLQKHGNRRLIQTILVTVGQKRMMERKGLQVPQRNINRRGNTSAIGALQLMKQAMKVRRLS